MTATKQRFSGLMGTPEGPATAGSPAVTAVPDLAPVPAAQPEPAEKKSKAKVQLNTQQPEDLKNAADKAAAYLSFTTGKKVTTTDLVERALRAYLEQLPPEATGL